MTSFKQFAANRANARKSTGPVTEKGKEHSRCNAVRHGLTAETVIGALEDSEDYRAFEAAITADYDAQSAVERELVLRLASLLWRLRRATAVETGLFDIEAKRPGNRNADRYSTVPRKLSLRCGPPQIETRPWRAPEPVA
jgi:anti-sigma-K factor RskA